MILANQKEVIARTILRNDKSFRDSIYTSNLAAVYMFDTKWTKLNIEGTLILYRRTVAPFMKLHLFNRKSLNDFELYLYGGLNFKKAEHFINVFCEDCIYGIWFHDEDHAADLYNLLRRTG